MKILQSNNMCLSEEVSTVCILSEKTKELEHVWMSVKVFILLICLCVLTCSVTGRLVAGRGLGVFSELLTS